MVRSLTVILGCLITSTSMAADLFELVDQTVTELKPEQETILSQLRDETTAAEVVVTRLNMDALSEQAVRVNPFADVPAMTYSNTRSNKMERGVQWVGRTGEGIDSTASMTTIGEVTYGTFPQGQYVISVRPLGNGLHAVIKRDVSKVQEEPADYIQGSLHQMRLSDATNGQPQSDSTTITIRVLVVYTNAVQQNHLDVEEFISVNLIDRSNSAFEDSDINVRFELADAIKTSYMSTESLSKDLNRIEKKGDSHMDNVHTVRDNKKADVVVLLIDKADAAGLASEIKAKANEAFAVMDDEYDWYFTFAHEIGHLMGCWHNPEAHATQNPHMSFGHGFQNISGTNKWRTIMSYNGGCNCTRVGVWSSPLVTYPDVNGSAAGTAAKHDNRRVWLERALTVSKFR